MQSVKNSNHGANVRRWREWRNIKQDVLAEQIGVSQATLSSYERKDKLEQELLDKIANALEIPTEAITELDSGTSINIFSGTWNDNANAANVVDAINYNPTFNPIDKIVELYERMLKEKDSVVELLQEIVKDRK